MEEMNFFEQTDPVTTIEAEPPANLDGILALLDDDELRFFIDLQAYEGLDTDAATREDLEKLVKNILGDPLLQQDLMLDLDGFFRQQYDELIRTGSITFVDGDEDGPNPALRGFLDALSFMMVVFPFRHGDKLTYLFPEEVQAAYEKAADEEFLGALAKVDIARNYVEATTNLYGVVAKSDIVDLIMKHDHEGNPLAETVDYANDLIYDAISNIGLWPEFDMPNGVTVIAHPLFSDVDGLGQEFALELMNVASRTPRYQPSTEELLRYVDPHFHEDNFEAELLLELLMTYFPDHEAENAEAVAFVQECARQGMKNEILIETIFEEFLPEPFANDAQAHLVIKQIAKLVNTTRTWGYNGHAPCEL